ncbi:NAD/NADP octopine/nopaline dehydrogenase family protein [Castellaniella sp. GW247-6E4]|uniref:NAD/NADP octopine/nopaline dehydrogenase family protein n=1 Tax=Castellaniella sp. GW247-6E4 TaxID=3140380 RepID=UPI003315CB68
MSRSSDTWCIIGAGMGGKGLVAELGTAGIRLHVHDIDEMQIAGMREAGGLHVEGRDANFAPTALATTDLAAAVQGTSVILISTYGNAHPAVARMLAPLLVDGQTIVLIQGHFAGSLAFRAALDAAGCRANVNVGDMDAYPYMLTVKAPDRVLMTSTKEAWSLAAYPASSSTAIMDRIGSAFPGMRAAPNLLHTAFNDLGGLFHVAGMITNVAMVETPGAYNFYANNMVPSVCRLIEKLDQERVAAAQAYSVVVPNVRDWLVETYALQHPTLEQSLQEMAVTHYRYAPAPKSLSHRYLVQDVACDLVPMAELSRAAGISTPAMDAAIGMANALTGRDFIAEGRNMQSLGLEGKSVEEIVADISA